VDDIEVLRCHAIDGFAARSFGNRRLGAEGQGKFTGVHESTIFRSRDDMLVISESAAPSEAVEFLRGVGRLGFGRIGCIARANRREARVGMMKLSGDLLFGHAFQLGLWGGLFVLCGPRLWCVFVREKTSDQLVTVEILEADRVVA
jgi:hypothetical protein